MVEVERSVEMREQLAAARFLPAKALSKPAGVYGKKHEIALAGEIFGQSAGDLVPCRQMDEAVAGIVGRAPEAPAFPRLLQGCRGADFVNRLRHGMSAGAAHRELANESCRRLR